MSFVTIISFVALFAIGFFFGMKITQGKMQPRIDALKRKIRSMQTPEVEDEVEPEQK